MYLHPAEAQGLAAVALAGGVGVAVLAAAGDAHVVVGAARPRVVAVHHRLHVQRRGRGHLARVPRDGEAHRVPGILIISSNIRWIDTKLITFISQRHIGIQLVSCRS